MTGWRIYLLAGAILCVLLTLLWGQRQVSARIKAESSLKIAQEELSQAQTAIAQRDIALLEMQRSHNNQIIAAKEREKRLNSELESYNDFICEIEELKKIDQTAAEFGATVYHPEYLNRVKRNAPK